MWNDQYDPEPEPVFCEEPDSEWTDEEEIVAMCDNPSCGREIPASEEVMTAMARDAHGKLHPICLCGNCVNDMDFCSLLDLLGVWNDFDRADDAVKYARKRAVDLNRAEKNRMTRTITKAAKMKGAMA